MSDTAVVSMIQSAEDFLATLKPGDLFFYMSSRKFRPYAIEGPFKILDFVRRGKEGFLNVKCRNQSGRAAKIEYYSVNDLTNEHHGVFTDEEEAWAYFKERQRAFDAAIKAQT